MDGGALRRAANAPLPDDARAVPLHLTLPLPTSTTQLLGHAVFLALVLGGGSFQFGIAPTGPVIALIATGLTLTLISAAISGGLDPIRNITIDDGGIHAQRVVGSFDVSWWQVRSVQAQSDLSDIAVTTDGRTIVMRLDRLEEPRRASAVYALRARLPEDVSITEARRSKFGRPLVGQALAVLGSVAIVGSFYADVIPGGSLGIRCSGPSSYLDKRFALPAAGQGCVVVRVSGGAKNAGVRQGDRMIMMNGAPITSGTQFNNRFLNEPTRTYDFVFIRAGVEQPLHLMVKPSRSSPPDKPADDALTWYLLARGNPDRQQAIEGYFRAIELAPDFDLAYLFRAGLEVSDFGYTDVDMADLQIALRLNPQLAEAYRNLALDTSGHIFTDAAVPIAQAQHAIDLDRCDGGFVGVNWDCARDYATLADVLRFRTDTVGSIRAGERALDFCPTSAVALYQLALSHEILKDRNEAIDYATRYLASSSADRGDDDAVRMQALLTRLHAN